MSKKKPLIIFFLFFLVLTTPFIFIDKENENKFSINKNINSLNLVTHKGESLKFNKFHNIPSIFFFGEKTFALNFFLTASATCA